MPIDRTHARKAVEIYCAALLEATKTEGKVFEASGQLDVATKSVRGNMQLREALTDRTIPGDDRAKIAKEVFADMDKAVVEVLGVLTERDDLSLLPRVAESYSYMAEDELGAVFIDVSTVVALDDKLRTSIKEKYSAQFGREVLLREHVDPSLVGGLVLSTHGNKIDASVATQLDRARIALATQVETLASMDISK